MPPNRHLRRQNPITFLARHESRRKCFVRAFTPVFPPMTSKRWQCSIGPCGSMPAGGGWTIALQVREVNSGAARREAREKILEAARRRELDLVLVWRLDRWGRS